MPALTIPEIFFKGWFWFGIAMPIAVIVYLVRKKSPASFSKTDNFFIRHKVIIRKALDIFLICTILFCWLLPLSFAGDIFRFFSPTESFRPETQQLDQAILLIPLIILSGQSSLLLGLISVFHTNLTKTKRIILLFACLLPVVFTLLLLLTDKTLGSWSIIRLCILNSFLSWIVNASAIFTNKPFFQFTGDIVRKLMLGYHSI
jgi:hypothetical protein